ncbi:MAG: flagellar motor protein MotB [Planctomycetota bacterium]
MGRKKKAEEHAHSESWLVSYCDMISLLVTFFLMMMTFSTKDEYNVAEVGVGLLKGRGGIWNTPLSYPQQTDVEPSVVGRLAREVAAACESDGDGQPASLRPLVDGFTISFDLDSSFPPGSADVTEALRTNLIRFGRALHTYTHMIVVEGFTDDRFQSTPRHPSAEALGLARAQSAARVLLESSLVLPDQIQIATHGELRPRASNDTALGRTSNRRVELRVVSLAKPSAESVRTAPREER